MINKNDSPKNIVVEEFRERGSSETQQHETRQGDDSLSSQRPKGNIVKSVRYRDKNFVGTHIFVGPINNEKSSSFEEERGVEKKVQGFTPRHSPKLRLSSSATSLG